jgi:hypothetical protein
MKVFFISLIILLSLSSATPAGPVSQPPIKVKPAQNLIIVTIDGFRWQELFGGADEQLVTNEKYTPDAETMKTLYWSDQKEDRRKLLMPFFWSVIAKKGQVYGNRDYNNRVNVANLYAFSYPGYNEIFTGTTDLLVSSNKKRLNNNPNVLEYLNSKEGFAGKIAAFTSWDVFPYILNEQRSGFPVNSGYETVEASYLSEGQQLVNKVQDEAVYHKGGTRFDQLTFLSAREYLEVHKPRVLMIGLGEGDEFAHAGRYDMYLQQANKADRLLAEIWHWVQTTPGYKDNTSIIITTDHGRGKSDSKWASHHLFVKGSSQTWLAMMGPGVEPLGEIKEDQQLYLREVAGVIAGLVGEEFEPGTKVTAKR